MSNIIRLLTICILTFFTTACASCLWPVSWIAADAGIIRSGTLSARQISEASGLAPSGLRENMLWVVNDSGNAPLIFAISTQGEYLGAVKIMGVKNIDWEDLASFEYGGKPYLLIADVGDNRARRKRCLLHIVEEPDLNGMTEAAPVSVRPDRTLRFRYEDGPRDCEAVAVDATANRILLLSKRERPPVLYELPLSMTDGKKRKHKKKKTDLVARRLGQITTIPQPTEEQIKRNKFYRYASQPTAMAIAPDRSSAVILTYRHAYYFPFGKNTDWFGALSQTPRRISLPLLQQAESVCFSRNGKFIYITSEKIPAPLLRADTADYAQ